MWWWYISGKGGCSCLLEAAEMVSRELASMGIAYKQLEGGCLTLAFFWLYLGASLGGVGYTWMQVANLDGGCLILAFFWFYLEAMLGGVGYNRMAFLWFNLRASPNQHRKLTEAGPDIFSAIRKLFNYPGWHKD